ncbi:LytR/AlgR family response regulator transcription factor [Spirosoma panaciterrae]|uniref:LytR/AlgR family response regulator transcription factor n=1 Tax=Spirosoma panaciterrae TaxID=496058 RepID=UPI00036B026C|nr:LytTR family DNA-binding domain-containing protein [Spirosoma panaciterrae]
MQATIRAFIVEDIPDNRINLTVILAEYCPQVSVEGYAEGVEEAYRLICNLQPDLIFLDIGLRDGTGFDLLERLQLSGRPMADVLFLTGENRYEYATRAFEYSAIDFLDKPVDPHKLCRAIDRASQQLNAHQYRQQVALLLDILKQPTPQLDGRLALHLPRGVVEVTQVADIVRCEADGVITHVFRKNGTKLTAMRNLGHYRQLLVNDYNFFAIDHGEIINLDYLHRYDHRDRIVTLSDGTLRYASRRCGQELGQYLKQNPLPGNGFSRQSLFQFVKKLLP